MKIFIFWKSSYNRNRDSNSIFFSGPHKKIFQRKNFINWQLYQLYSASRSNLDKKKLTVLPSKLVLNRFCRHSFCQKEEKTFESNENKDCNNKWRKRIDKIPCKFCSPDQILNVDLFWISNEKYFYLTWGAPEHCWSVRTPVWRSRTGSIENAENMIISPTTKLNEIILPFYSFYNKSLIICEI